MVIDLMHDILAGNDLGANHMPALAEAGYVEVRRGNSYKGTVGHQIIFMEWENNTDQSNGMQWPAYIVVPQLGSLT